MAVTFSRMCTKNFKLLILFTILVISCAKDKNDKSLEVEKAQIYALPLSSYYAHPIVEDEFGVIAPWYQRQNGQLDERRQVSVNVIKRYPWEKDPKNSYPGPHYLFNGRNTITSEGDIRIRAPGERSNGDLIEQATYMVAALIDYYAYSGDPTIKPIITRIIDYYLNVCLTSEEHPWPGMVISVPVAGEKYGNCSENGFIQLDIAAAFGTEVLKAYRMIGKPKWKKTAEHWGALLARNRDSNGEGRNPWNRYAILENDERANKMRGGVAQIGIFFDSLLEMGFEGDDQEIRKAKNEVVYYIKTSLLPAWASEPDTWGRAFWDWEADIQTADVTNAVSRFMMANRDSFPNWEIDVRNITTMMLNHASVFELAPADVYSGAWQHGESTQCCRTSMAYSPLHQSWTWSIYSTLTGDLLTREMARRIALLTSYDFHPTGLVEDLLTGGSFVAPNWFKIAHPFPLFFYGQIQGHIPELAPAKENHVLLSSEVVEEIKYRKNTVSVRVHDTAQENMVTLRLAFMPSKVLAGETVLKEVDDVNQWGFTTEQLPDGDIILRVHYKGDSLEVSGVNDPQVEADITNFIHDDNWRREGLILTTSAKGSKASFTFSGNQFRILGLTVDDGGEADIYLDGKRLLTTLDFHSELPGEGAIFSKSGLSNGAHTISIVARGTGNPYSKGSRIYITGIQYSASMAKRDFGSGRGPGDGQHVVAGYDGRKDIIDSEGRTWRPATEFVIPLGTNKDSFSAWWPDPVKSSIELTNDDELYRYGLHGRDFKYNFTVRPGEYCLRLMFAATRPGPQYKRTSIEVNGSLRVQNMDVETSAEGLNRAFDLVFPGVQAKNGTIQVRFIGGEIETRDDDQEAYVQALSISPVCEGDKEGIPLTQNRENAFVN